MDRSAKTTLTLCAGAGIVICGVVALHDLRQQPAAASSPTAGDAQPVVEAPAPDQGPRLANGPALEPVRPRPRPAAAPRTLEEPALMAAIRELGAADPARALELARDGNRRFPNSADAAERTWTICKSLAALGRSTEAQQEARQMMQQYPDTTWAADVRRHLLTQPLEDPSQRGYGKSSELQ